MSENSRSDVGVNNDVVGDAALAGALVTGGGLASIPEEMHVAIGQLSRANARRCTPFTKERRRLFLDGIGVGLTTTAAARLVGVDRRTVYYAMKHDKDFAEEYESARDVAAEMIEARLQRIALEGEQNSMATVRAAEVLLKGLSHRYRNQAAPTKVVTATDGDGRAIMSVRVGIPGPD